VTVLTTTNENLIAERFIDSQLRGAGIEDDPPDELMELVSDRVYAYAAPQGVTYPFIVHGRQASTDFTLLGGTRLWSDLLYLVRAVGRVSSWSSLAPIADLIDARLHEKSGPVEGGGAVLSCIRVEPFTLVEVVAGVQYRQMGGVYRLLAQAQE